jgi:hypothetical protein
VDVHPPNQDLLFAGVWQKSPKSDVNNNDNMMIYYYTPILPLDD